MDTPREGSTRHLELGKPVMSSDNERVGNVDGLVIDSDTKEIRQFIVQQGMLMTTDRIVDRPIIDYVDDDGAVHLNIASDTVDQLPPFVQREYVIATEENLRHLPQAWVAGFGTGPVYWGSGYTGRGYDPRGSMFEPAPANPPVVETESNLREDTTVITTGTDVVGSDGDKVGTVDEIIYNDDGEIGGFVVKAGFLFHHDVQVPSNWIEAIEHDRVQLNVTADEAANAGSTN